MEEKDLKQAQKNNEKTNTKFKDTKLILTNVNQLSIYGVSKVLSSTATGINLLLNGQTLSITGSDLSTTKLDTQNGILEATGNFYTFKFAGHKQKENFFKRIFG